MIAIVRSAPLSSGVSPVSPTSSLQKVSELVFLRLEVALVVRVGLNADGNALDNLEPEPFQPIDLFRVVGHQTNLAHAKVVQDLAANAVVALVGGMPQRLVRLDRVKSSVLEVVCVKLVEQADASP